MSSSQMMLKSRAVLPFREVWRKELGSRSLANKGSRALSKTHLAPGLESRRRNPSRAVSRNWKSHSPISATQQSTTSETENSDVNDAGTSGQDDEVQTQEVSPEREPIVVMAEKMGFDFSEGIFGFTPFSELWVGRQAMIGITLGVITEVLSGNTMLQQVGLDVQTAQAHELLFGVLWLALFGATAVGAGLTLSRAKSGQMTSEEYRRYAKFFGMNTEETAEMEASMRKEGGLTKLLEQTPTRVNAPNSSLQPNELLWTVLRGIAWIILAEERKDAKMEAGEPGAAVLTKDIELNAGRIAMLGFVAAILVEAATGAGVMQQLEFYSNIFAAESIVGLDVDDI